jgi:glycerol-3-phosphate dehydrogenase subunit B
MVKYEKKRDRWYSEKFFDRKSHPFLGFGVETDNRLNPLTQKGDVIKNMFCAGSVLSGYNPVKEGCGGGVAISTGYKCAERIIRELKK